MMLRYLITLALHRDFTLDNPWLAAADGFADAACLCAILLAIC